MTVMNQSGTVTAMAVEVVVTVMVTMRMAVAAMVVQAHTTQRCLQNPTHQLVSPALCRGIGTTRARHLSSLQAAILRSCTPQCAPMECLSTLQWCVAPWKVSRHLSFIFVRRTTSGLSLIHI